MFTGMAADALAQRIAQLDDLRIGRGLTAEERAEADRLSHRAYMRAWHADARAQSRRLAAQQVRP